MRWRPGIGQAQSVGAEEGEAEAVRSAEGAAGRWMGAPEGWRWRPGAATPAETPLSSDSGGPASGRWTKGPGEAEEGAEVG